MFISKPLISFVHRLLLSGVVAVFFVALPSPAFGQEAFKGELVISPAKIELPLNPGEEKTIQIKISSGFSKPVSLRVYTEDVGQSSDQFIGVELLGNEKDASGLKDYIHPLITSFTVKPGEVVALPVTVRLPSELSAQGRFGAIVFSLLGDDGSTAGAQALVDTRVGATIFVRPTVGALEKGEVVQFIPKDHTYIYVWEEPVFIVSFKNSGNVHLNPYGGIVIRNVFGLEKSRTEIAPWFVLPGSTRSLIVHTPTRWLIGYYKAELLLAPGYGTVTSSGTVGIWVLSREWIITLLALATLALIGLVLRARIIKQRS